MPAKEMDASRKGNSQITARRSHAIPSIERQGRRWCYYWERRRPEPRASMDSRTLQSTINAIIIEDDANLMLGKENRHLWVMPSTKHSHQGQVKPVEHAGLGGEVGGDATGQTKIRSEMQVQYRLDVCWQKESLAPWVQSEVGE